MSTQAQIDANRQNAKQSTGPKTAEGRASSAANSTRHGLQANPTTILENNPRERSQYDTLKTKLLKQIRGQPEASLSILLALLTVLEGKLSASGNQHFHCSYAGLWISD